MSNLLYRIKSSTKLAESSIPAHLTTLSVSWLNKQFKAVAIHRGVVEGSWESPTEIEGASHFEELVREAVKNTGYHGNTVSLVLAHQRMVQQLVDLPPVKGQALTRLVERQASQQKFFPSEAVFAWQNCPSAKGTQRVILHLFPKILLHQLIQGARKNDLHLTAVLPPFGVLHQQVAALPFDKTKDEVEILAAETGGSTTVVIARGESDLLLARNLPGSWNEEPERLAVDLNRTLLYAGQQYGISPKKGLWVFGKGAKEKAPEVQKSLGMPVNLSPVDDTPFYWATEAVKLRPAATPNFVSHQLQMAPQRRVFAKVVAALVVLVLLVSFGASGLLALQTRAERRIAKELAGDLQHLQERHKELQRRNAELDRKQKVVDLVAGGRATSVPFWLLAYLGEAVPPELVLTNLVVRQETNQWRVQMAGVGQIGPRATNTPPLSYSIATLRQRLATGPFRLALAEPESKKAPDPQMRPVAAKSGESKEAILAWLGNVRNVQVRTNTTAAEESWFSFEGVMRND
jgi:hypothetical protein